MTFYADIQELGLPSGRVVSHLRCVGELGDWNTIDLPAGNKSPASPPEMKEFFWGEKLVVFFGIRPDKEAALEEMRRYVTRLFPGEPSELNEWDIRKMKPRSTVGAFIMLG